MDSFLQAWPAALTLLIVAGTVYGFVSERHPPDLTALLALLALLLSGILSPTEAFAGFSHPATVSVAAVIVLSAGLERTGALSFLARRVLAPLGHSELLLTAALMAVIATLSAFINNTAAVAVFLPAVLQVCRRTGVSPGRVLMPMAHAATFGGMCTLIGTSTNLVAHEYAVSQGLRGFTMFELGKVGLPMLGVGCAYILLVGRFFLPRSTARAAGTDPKPYVAELVVLPGSSWLGREVQAHAIHRDFDLDLIEIVRGGRPLMVGQGTPRFEEGDTVKVQGPVDRLLALEAAGGLAVHRPSDAGSETEPQPALAEIVLLPASHLIGRTLKDARFSETHGVPVLGIHRRGGAVDARPSTTRLRAGDILVVEGGEMRLRELEHVPGFLVVEAKSPPEERPRKLGVALLTLAGVVTVVSFGLLPIVTAATAGCAVLMLTGCLRPREAYEAIDWSVIFLLAGTLGLGMALQKTGVTESLAGALATFTGMTGPFVALVGFFLVSMVVSELMSNSGTVALLAPVAVATAASVGMNPLSLLAAITFGASASFAMPTGYHTSLMIYGPGGYRFKDFLRLGIVLDVLLAVVALWLIPQYWPLLAE